MAFHGSAFAGLLLVVAAMFAQFENGISSQVLTRTNFPDSFLFGTASAAYQYEGASKEDGKGPSIWDTFTHESPAKIANNSNGDVAIDFYHRFKNIPSGGCGGTNGFPVITVSFGLFLREREYLLESVPEDVKLMKGIGLDAFRFSISWPRLLPSGKLSGGINQKGVDFYNSLINELVANGLQPFVTLFHWDLPQALEDEYGGFLSPRIMDDFQDFAEVCFKEFGDRVKNWITLNEPQAYALTGYDLGVLAPGRCSPWRSTGCQAGDSGIEPYIVSHHLLLSHAAANKIYKEKYQACQKGKIGISLVSVWMVPSSHSKSDKRASHRAMDFNFGWFMEPLTSGAYPKSMCKIVGNRLPTFTDDEAGLVKGSFDFIGLNYYFTTSASDVPSTNSTKLSYLTDSRANLTFLQDKKLIHMGVTNVTMYPEGLKDMLVYTKKKYGDQTIYITENGMADTYVSAVEQGVNDYMRIYFYKRHLLSLLKAIESGVNVKGYFAWSFLDNFEWTFGYNSRYGIVYVDYNDGLRRYLKLSALWFKKLLVGY